MTEHQTAGTVMDHQWMKGQRDLAFTVGWIALLIIGLATLTFGLVVLIVPGSDAQYTWSRNRNGREFVEDGKPFAPVSLSGPMRMRIFRGRVKVHLTWSRNRNERELVEG